MHVRTLLPVNMLTRLLINRNFGLLWIGLTISGMGDFFFDTTLILWMTTGIARGQAWLPFAVSGIVLAASIPQLVVGPFAGVLIDRWDKRSTMLWMDVLRAILVMQLIVTTGLLPLPFGANLTFPLAWKLGSIYIVIVLQSCCAQFFSPAQQALTADIVPDAERVRSVSMSSISFNIALLLVPTLAALLFVAFGAVWAIVIDALSFFVSFLFVFQLRPPEAARSIVPGEKGNYFRELLDGLCFLRGNRVLIVLLVAGIIFNFGAGTFNAFYLLFILNYIHAPVKLAGLFALSYGGGVLLGSIVASRVARRMGEGRLFWLSLVSWGSLLLFFARMTSLQPALFLNCLLGFSNAGINIVVGPLLMRFTRREYMGRVFAIFGPVIKAVQLLSVMIAGFVMSTLIVGLHVYVFGMVFRPLDTIFVVVGLLALVAGVYVLLALRGVNLKPNEAEYNEGGGI